jgi:hypothetical protein
MSGYGSSVNQAMKGKPRAHQKPRLFGKKPPLLNQLRPYVFLGL